MEQYGSSEGSRSDPSPEWAEPEAQTGLEEPVWQLGMGGGAGEESYPQRPDEVDCTYYLRTGFCGFGSRCRFNHPRDRAVVAGAERTAGEHPERVGQPVCQYFMRTRTCKFGSSCKYHHPRQAGAGGAAATPVSLNYYGYPLRQGEKECSYYVKTGQCKFGATCKFHHPVPAGIQIPPSPFAPVSPLPVPVPSPLYSTMQPPPGPSSQQIGVLVARPPMLPGSLVQSPYGPVVLSPAMVPISGWGPYQASASGAVLPSGTPSNVGSAQLYGITQLPSPAAAYPGPYPPSGSPVGPPSSSQKEQAFPERSNQPEYQYYLKTGEVKFGPSYRYNPPPDMSVPDMSAPKANVILSPAGLPLRPGAPACTHYAQHGVCKFGSACKFDHPMGSMSYSPSASSLADMPVAPYPVGSTIATLAPSSSSSDLRPEPSSGSSKESVPSRMPSSTLTGSIGSTLSTGGPISQSSTQPPSQSSGPLAAVTSTTSSNVSHTSS
ncbi:Zinc finger CCCH domain-containing protein 32 [Glycine soja]|nr:Zinc finger CCCH domain-containing protein 32 [Glycine soja]